ncbi:MAG: ABC transporter permease [Anaerolineales bacterium]|nr:ABC transporter permease [Anaerolineales bacterium]
MSLTETLRVAFRALAANKLRSLLTMLGIIIGVAAVIALMSVGRGVENYVTRTFQGIGSNLLFVIPGGPDQAGFGPEGPFRRREKPLTMDDVRALSDPSRLPDVVAVAPAAGNFASVEFGRENAFVQVLGVPPNYAEVSNYSVNDGDWFSENDERGAARVAVLGQTVVKRLFRDELPLGQTVKINQVPFRVIGTLTPRGGGLFGDQDNIVFIPLSTAQQRVYNLRTADGKLAVSSISLQVRDASLMDSTAQQVAEVLRDSRGINFRDEDDFTVITQQDLISSFGQITGALTLFLGLIAGVSLLVGGIGIMNIMLVSVTERTREIGLRKAVGAKRRDVLQQFLVEAMTLSLFGGLLGVAVGAGLGALIQFIQPDLPVAVTPDSVALATGVSLAIGLFFGLYPAWRAAQLNPIEALRYE